MSPAQIVNPSANIVINKINISDIQNKSLDNNDPLAYMNDEMEELTRRLELEKSNMHSNELHINSKYKESMPAKMFVTAGYDALSNTQMQREEKNNSI